MSPPNDESPSAAFVEEVDGEPHQFVIREEMTQTTPVMHEDVVVDLGPLAPPSRGLVDAELLPLLELLPSMGLSTPGRLAEVRSLGEAIPRPTVQMPGVQTSEAFIPGPPGAPELRVLITRNVSPAVAAMPALQWIHGGGFVLGHPEQNLARMELIASQLHCVVVSVAYRLAPETPHPGPVEDCYAALRWMQQEAESLNIDRARLAVAAESAGGGLAASVMLLARDRRTPLPRIQALIYPMLDDRTTSAEDPYAGHFVWTADDNAFAWSCPLDGPTPRQEVSPYAAASRASYVEGLPPAYICVGTLDLFLTEDLDYARRLRAAGVDTELRVVPGAFHGFFNFDGMDIAESLFSDLERVLARAFRG